MYGLKFTKQELESGIIQLGARLDELKKIQKEEARNENVQRVIEMEEHMKPIRSFYDKLTKAFYNL